MILNSLVFSNENSGVLLYINQLLILSDLLFPQTKTLT